MSTKPLHVVQVLAYYPPHLGGMERVAQALSTELAAQGHSVQVLTSDVGHPSGSVIQAGVHVHYLKSKTVANTPIMLSLSERLHAIPQDSIIHVHVAHAFVPEVVAMVARKRRIPYIVHLHLDTGRSGVMGWLLPLYKKLFLKRVLRGAAAVIVLTEEYRTLVQEKYGITQHVHVVPNGVDASFLLRKPAGIHAPANILSVGRLSVQKRVKLLLDAVPLLKKRAHIDIIGAGEQEDELKAQAKEQSLSNVTFHGSLTGKPLLARYAAADIFILPSEREGLPLVLLEAMAASTPIVATNVLGTKEFLGDSGLLVDSTPGALAAGIDRLLGDPALRNRFRARGLARAKQLTWPHVTAIVERIYAEVLGTQPRTTQRRAPAKTKETKKRTTIVTKRRKA